MKPRMLVLSLALIGTCAYAGPAQYIGSFTTQGSITFADSSTSYVAAPNWWNNPSVYSGLEAAALLFGGSASDYAISTIQGSINHQAWYDGWGDHGGRQFAESYKLDLSGLGYNGCATAGINCDKSAYSAYIHDGFSGTNYVYRVAAVPEPDTVAMLLAGLGILGSVARRRRAA